jgi:hypothetical protein
MSTARATPPRAGRISPTGEGIESDVDRADDEEGSAEDHALVAEHVRHD